MIAQAFDGLKQAKIIHRDIKPENFITAMIQHIRTIFHIDFGIAKYEIGTTFLGTKGYMSPEIFHLLSPGKNTPSTYSRSDFFYFGSYYIKCY